MTIYCDPCVYVSILYYIDDDIPYCTRQHCLQLAKWIFSSRLYNLVCPESGEISHYIACRLLSRTFVAVYDTALSVLL